MGRRLYYRDSYGRLRRDRRAERACGRSLVPARFFVFALVVLAAIVVLAALLR